MPRARTDTQDETRTSSMKDSAQEKVPVTQTLSFCQMHFLSPLPVAFDRKLVSVFPFLGSFARAKKKPHKKPTCREQTFVVKFTLGRVPLS